LSFELFLWHGVSDDINRLPDKTRRIIQAALKRLEEDPYPGKDGDKEKMVLKGGEVIYRLHISRSFTTFYDIDKENKRILVQEVLPIGKAHKKYGYY
jgi:mRNA interferase RelE/StbE